MNRNDVVARIEEENKIWDVLVIGGGASGLGTAVDAASRGYSTLLLEGTDFAKGTSSRSTKIIHGGVRYLKQGNIALVKKALRERGFLMKNAPELVHKMEFVIPVYSPWKAAFYWLGLIWYDLLAGKYSLGDTMWVSKHDLQSDFPNLKSSGLVGGIRYFDAQFDDARLAIQLARTCTLQGGSVVNYMKVIGLIHEDGKVQGVVALDLETGKQHRIKSKCVINATGVFVDTIHQMDQPESSGLVRASQGTHLVLDQSFLPGNRSIMIPKTPDGRVVFIVPWLGHVLLGTTDVLVEAPVIEPVAQQEEIDYLLNIAGDYLSVPPGRKDVLTVFSGLRPLKAPAKEGRKTKEIPRDHTILVSGSGLITIVGGKWTTYRLIGEKAVDRAMLEASLPHRPCRTMDLKIFSEIQNEAVETEFLDAGKRITSTHVIDAVRYEMARSVEDVLARRHRLLFLEADQAIAIAEKVARIMARELHQDQDWVLWQTEQFKQVASGYKVNR